MASTEKTVTLWLFPVFLFVLVLAVNDVRPDEIRRKTLTFHPSLLHTNSRNTRDIVLPANAFNDDADQDISIKQSVPQMDEGGRVKRDATVLPQGSVRGLLPTLPANSTSVVSCYLSIIVFTS